MRAQVQDTISRQQVQLTVMPYSALPLYVHKSLLELRAEDYALGRKYAGVGNRLWLNLYAV